MPVARSVGTKPPVEHHRLDHLRGRSGEDLVQCPQRYAGDQPLVTLPRLVLWSRQRIYRVTRLDVAVAAHDWHDLLRRQLELHDDIPVLRPVGDLVSAREAFALASARWRAASACT